MLLWPTLGSVHFDPHVAANPQLVGGAQAASMSQHCTNQDRRSGTSAPLKPGSSSWSSDVRAHTCTCVLDLSRPTVSCAHLPQRTDDALSVLSCKDPGRACGRASGPRQLFCSGKVGAWEKVVLRLPFTLQCPFPETRDSPQQQEAERGLRDPRPLLATSWLCARLFAFQGLHSCSP